MSSPRTYIVRGLDPTTAPFNCQGLLQDLPTYVEVADVPTEAKAIELMLTGPVAKMTTGVPPVSSASYLDVLNVKVELFNVNSTSEAKRIRKELAESIVTWAEKSRVRGVRGWRAHALKTPKIQRQPNGTYELDFDAILGHAVFYNERVLSVGHTDDQAFLADTVADLRKHLARTFTSQIGQVTADHAAKNLTVTA